MEHSATLSEIAKALAKFQGEVTDPAKDKDNPYFKSKYVALDGLISVIRPIMSRNGLSFMQTLGGDGQTITITTTILHESGEYITSDPFPLKPVKSDPQAAGSAVTYGRRYSLSAALGIGWQEDDDANIATDPNRGQETQAKSQQKHSQRPQNTPQQAKQQQPIDTTADEKKNVLKALLASMRKDGMGADEMKQLIQWKFKKQGSQDMTLQECKLLAAKYQQLWEDMMQELGGKSA